MHKSSYMFYLLLLLLMIILLSFHKISSNILRLYQYLISIRESKFILMRKIYSVFTILWIARYSYINYKVTSSWNYILQNSIKHCHMLSITFNFGKICSCIELQVNIRIKQWQSLFSNNDLSIAMLAVQHHSIGKKVLWIYMMNFGILMKFAVSLVCWQ
jgi:hypothetical protein